MPEASETLPCDPRSVPAARRFVLRTLAAWGHDDAGWAAAQIASELASNCALHARTDFDVRLVEDDGGLRLEVRDSSPGRVQQRRYSNESTTGRGLLLVDSLARSWGVDLHDGGKTVWVALRATADLSDVAEGDAEVDLDVLLASFGDDEPGLADRTDPARAGRHHGQVAA